MATNDRMALLEELRKYLADKDTDFLREAVTLVVNPLMDSEVSSALNLWLK